MAVTLLTGLEQVAKLQVGPFYAIASNFSHNSTLLLHKINRNLVFLTNRYYAKNQFEQG